jgi:Spy/CpxP family protein refolding chaperone
MKLMRIATLLLTAVLTVPALAQEHQHQQHTESPYTDLTSREIKALSAEDVTGLLAGEGMGFALSAELNGFPGPRHVLDMAEQLSLTDTQVGSTQALFDEMNADSREMGERLVALEGRLDEAFAGRSIDETSLRALTTEIGQLRGSLRATHLGAHLRMIEILNQNQVHSYNMLRGYHESR